MSNEFPPYVGDSTVFLVKDGKVMATAFIVGIRDNPADTNSRSLYLVTARHNIERAGANTVLKARHNLKNGTYLEGEYNTDKFFQHPTTDIAVHPLRIAKQLAASGAELLHYGWDDYTMLRRDEIEDGAVSWGSEVVVTSMFQFHTGITTMQSIQRFGKIAMIPKEQILVSVGASKQFIEAILIETMVWPGASGAPVFTNRSKQGTSIYDKIPIRLLGLVSSHFEITTKDKSDKSIDRLATKIAEEAGKRKEDNNRETIPDESVDTKGNTNAPYDEEVEIGKVHVNTGITVVIPAYQIREFLLKVHKDLNGWLPVNTNFWELQ